MPTRNTSDFDEMFDKMENNFGRTAKHARAGILGMGLVILLIALALTVVGIILATTVSPWFWIAVIVTGGYTVLSALWIFVASSITRSVR